MFENKVSLTECNSMYYSNNYKNFNDWFSLVKNKKEVYPFCKIPYENWFNNYIDEIRFKSIEEVKELIRWLLSPFSRELDIKKYEIFNFMVKNKINYYRIKDNEFYNRIKNDYEAWEGLTWIVGLLPNKPYKAIEALQLYLTSEVSILPDDRVTGIEQCIQIILAKFISFEEPAKELLNLKPFEFEKLINNLYVSMGYKTRLTNATRDGGKDIIAEKNSLDKLERVYIECKLYNKTKLTAEYVRAFAYIISNDKVNRGVIFCTGYVSDNVKKIDRRIQILTYNEISILLNAYLGLNWSKNLYKILNS